MDASKRPHRVQIKVQLLKEVCGLTHSAREACQTFRQVSVVLVFGLGHVLRVWMAVHNLGGPEATAPSCGSLRSPFT